MDSRSGNRKLSSEQCAVLSGLCYCATCGRRLIYRSYRGGYLNCENTHEGQRYVPYARIMSEFKATITALELPDAEELDLYQNQQNELIQAKMADVANSATRVKKSLHVASTAFVDGILDAEEYQAQKQRLNAQVAEFNAQLQELQQALLDEEHAAGHAKRTEDFKREALERLDGNDIRSINAWLRSCVRIHVKDGHICFF